MSGVLILGWCIAALCAVLYGEVSAILGVGLLAVVYLLAVSWDLMVLTRVDRAPSRRRRAIPVTSLGVRLARFVEALAYRIDALEWQIQAPAPRLKTRELLRDLPSLPRGVASAPSKSADSASERDVLTTAVTGIFAACSQSFRAKGIALVLPVNSHGDLVRRSEEIAGWRVWSQGVGGTHWEAQVRQVLTPWLEHGREEALARDETTGRHSLFAEFSTYGFRHTIMTPLSWDGLHGSRLRGALWLGYEPHRAPLDVEGERAQELGGQVSRELAALSTLRELSGKLVEAEEVNRQKSDFIAQMSHDIRSPLNNIKAILTLFALEERSNDDREMIEAALANCTSLSEIVEDILDFSRHSAGRLVANPELFDLTECIAEVADGFSGAAKLKKLTVRLAMACSDDDHVFVRGDRRQLRRIVTNLISNALKYTAEGGVEISLRAEGGRAVLHVADTGCGMSAHQLNQLFTPFTRLHTDDPKMAQVDGIGLGLAVSRILLELNHGTIGVTSEVGRGSVFSVSLPAAEAPARVVSYPTHLHREEASRGAVRYPHKVLVVDDDVDCVVTTARGLQRAGFEVMQAFSVNEAIRMIKFEEPEVVITDDQMPDGGGRTLLGFLRRSARAPLCAVVSGTSESRVEAELRSLGAAEVFLKPVELEALAMWIRLQLSAPEDAAEVA